MAKPKSQDKGGRPPFKVDARALGQIEQLAGYGLTIKQIAAVLGCGPTTLHKLKKDEQAVSEAFEKGQAVAQAKVGKSLFEEACRGNITAVIWWEKTRAGRTDKPDPVQNTGPTGLDALADAIRFSVEELRREDD